MARFTYDDFRVTFAPAVGGVHTVTAVDAAGETVVGTFALPTDGALVEAVQRIARVQARGATARDVGAADSPAPDARRLGASLAAALLDGPVGERYDAALDAAERAGRGLRLSLSLADAPDLLAVPWEFVYRAPVFVASQRNTPIVRVLETGEHAEPPTISADVRILGVVSNPTDLAPLDVAGERRRVEQALAPMTELGRVTLDWLDPATPRRLREVLRDGNYHVLHYIGHSDFSDEGEGVLFLEDAAGSSTPVNSTVLANLLAEQSDLRLVVLNSCSAARTTLTEPYAGVATTLVQLGVPAVVAMQFPISDAAAITFGEELYTNLIARQEPIDAAVAEARKAVFVEVDDVEWATPVLFLRDPDVELLHFERPPVVTEPGRRRRRLLLITAGALVVAAVGSAGVLLTRGGSAPNAIPADPAAAVAAAGTRSLGYAFSVERAEGGTRIVVTSAQLGDVRDPIEDVPGHLMEPDWHPEREAIAFRRFVDGGWTGCELCVLLPEGGHVVPLAARQESQRVQHSVAWDARGDGAYYAVTHGCDVTQDGCPSDIMHVAQVGGAAVEVVTGVPEVVDIDVDPNSEQWRLLVQTRSGAFALDESGESPLYGSDDVSGVAFSPNSNRIVGIAEDRRTLLVWDDNGGDITSELHAEASLGELLLDSEHTGVLRDKLDALEMASISPGRDRRQPESSGEFAVLVVDSSDANKALAVVTLRADDDGPGTRPISVVDVEMLPFELTPEAGLHVRAVAQ